MPAGQETDRRSFLKYSGTAAAAATTVSMAGCTSSDDEDADEEETEDFEVTVTQGQLTETLDPIADNATPIYNIVDQAYEPFLYRDEEGRPIERIVTEWERIDDNTVQLEVRDGVQFHSGNEMTASDVAYSINRANGTEAGDSDVVSAIGDIDEAVVEDGDVIVNLNAVVPEIFRNLNAFGRVVEEEWVEERDGNLTTEMNGTGPYELVDFEEGSHVEYEQFDDYWGEEPDVTGGRFNAREESGPRIDSLLAGETDLIVNVPPEDISDVEEADNADSEFLPSIRSIFLVLNDAHTPFDDQQFRQAMNYAVDVEAIIESQLNEFGAPTSQPTLEGHAGYNPDVDRYPYDPDEAERLIDESGHDGEEITLHVPVGRYLGGVNVAESAAGQIDELDNVSCSVERRDFSALVGELIDPDQEVSPGFFLIGWGNPTFDADYTMTPWFRDDGDFQHFNDDEIQSLLSQADNEADPDARDSILQDANARANEIASWVFLHQQFSIYGTSDRIDWDAREDEDILFEEISRA